MNVRPVATPVAGPPQAGATPARRFDVTVSDGGVHVRPPARPTTLPAPAPTPAAAPTSTPEVAATLTGAEQQALSERFAALPRSGVTSVYDLRGRTTPPSGAGLQGRLLDITG